MNFHDKVILIVDDEPSNALTIKTILSEDGYTNLLIAHSAKEAYEILENENIELLLLDLVMPNTNGFQMCKSIRKDPIHSKIPIIFVTADTSNDALKNSFDAGANDYITKPINATNLLVRIRSVLLDRFKDTLILSNARQLAINETIHMLAHQWKQPLTAISSRALQLKLSFDLDSFDLSSEKGKEQQRTFFDQGLDEINDHVTKLTNSISAFRDLSSEQLTSTRDNINNVLRKSIDFIHDRCHNNNISIETEIDKNDNDVLFSNELIKVLLSLYNNSIEAFQKRNIEHKRVIKVVSTLEEDYTKITLTDNAGGITPDILPKVFNPYFTTKENPDLIGLGLYNASAILSEFLDASIHLTSKDDKTTITIKIPN